jgi:hypothetical protein
MVVAEKTFISDLVWSNHENGMTHYRDRSRPDNLNTKTKDGPGSRGGCEVKTEVPEANTSRAV